MACMVLSISFRKKITLETELTQTIIVIVLHISMLLLAPFCSLHFMMIKCYKMILSYKTAAGNSTGSSRLNSGLVSFEVLQNL